MQARDVLSGLKDLGLDAIKLSYDTEHGRFVSSEQIMAVVRAANTLNLKAEVYATFWDKTETLHDLLPELDGLATIQTHVVVPAGRAKQVGTWPRHDLREELKYSCGEPGYYSIAIYPDGDAYPCCSGDFNKKAKLSCGNINSDQPEDILRNAFANFHVRIAKELGFGAFYAMIREHYPDLLQELTPFSAVDSVCEICRDVRRVAAGKLDHVYERMEIEYVLTMAEWHWKKAAGRDAASAPLCVAGLPMQWPDFQEWLRTDSGGTN